MARSTRAAVSGSTPGSPLTTRDTVIRLTPAAAATSRMVGRLFTPPRRPAPPRLPATQGLPAAQRPPSASPPPASCPHGNVINLLPRGGSHLTSAQHGHAAGS